MARGMTPDDLYAISWVGECDISPDGKRVAFTVTRLDRERDESRSAIWIVAADGSGTAQPFTAGAHDTTPRWSPDGRWLAFQRKSGDDPAQIHVMPADGGEARQLTRRPLGAGAPAWSPDGTRIAFAGRTGEPPPPPPAAGAPKPARPFRRIDTVKYRLNGEGFTYDRRRHVHVVDIATGGVRQITRGNWDDTAPAWSPNGKTIAFLSARHRGREEDGHNQLWLVAGDRRTAPAARRRDGRGRRAVVVAGRATDRAGVRGASAGERHAARGERRRWGRRADRRRLRPSDRRRARPGMARWATAAGARARSRHRVTGDRGARPRHALGRPGPAHDHSIAVAADGRTAAVVLDTIGEPAEVYRLDLARGTLTRLTHLNRGWRREVRTQRTQHLAVRTAPGVEVDTWIMKPHGFRAGRRYPVLLNVHGGPFGQYGETFFDEFQVYAAAGYGVVFCNPRGGAGQSSDFASAIVGDMGGPDYHDVMTAFEAALRRMPWADERRLGVIGGSYGGFMTSWIIGHTDRFAAACSERAVNDWYIFQGTSDIGATFAQRYLGERATTYDDRDALLRQSPASYVKDMRTPVLILHSEDDLRCPISQAEAVFVPLRKLRRDVEFVRFPDENHELSRGGRPSHRVDRFAVILDYFGRKLARGGQRRAG